MPDDDVETNSNLISVGEAARVCGVSDETIRKWILAGALPFIEVGPNFVRRIYRRDAERMKATPRAAVTET